MTVSKQVSTSRGSCLAAFLLMALLSGARANAQDVRFRVQPDLLIPLAPDSTLGLGGGASLFMDMNLWNFFAPYLGADAVVMGMSEADAGLTAFLASGGAGLGFYLYPLPRLKLAASGGAGVYVGSYSNAGEDVMTGNAFWRAGAEVGYRFRPGFTLSGSASYVDYLRKSDSLYRGLALSLVVDIGLSSSSSEGRALLAGSESASVFPILAADYASSPFGTLTIANAEDAEIRDVQVWFAAEGYSSSPVLCATVPYIAKGGKATVPLVASFGEEVMAVTENVRVSGEISMKYTLLDSPRASSTEMTISILNRNALTWADPRVLASFASPNDPTVLDTSKFLAGVVRGKARQEIDSNLQYAIGVFEGLRLAGIAWTADPQTPYARMRAAPAEVDYVQFPYQTIAYRSGDSDDLAALYAAELESIGVQAGLIPLDGQVLVAVRMAQNEMATKGTFSAAGDFIFKGGVAWLPVSMQKLREGFLAAWMEGARLVRSDPAAGDRLYSLADAWTRFPPAGVPGVQAVARKPAEDAVRTAFDGALNLVVAKEVGPRAERIRSQFGSDGGSGRQRNSLGVLYARYGLYAEALAEFQAAAARSYVGAAVNIGNVAFLMADYKTAAAWFEKAMKDQPGDVAAIIGLARAYYELDRYDEADTLFDRATNIMPELAERYGYLSAKLLGSVTSRASDAASRGGGMLWGD